jgi:hypothetical protein
MSVKTTWNHPITRSNTCKSKCIDEGKNYCVNANRTGGYCCDEFTNCAPWKKTICSEDNPRAPKWYKYFVCPNEKVCGDQDIYPKYDDVTIREIEQYNGYFVKNDVCSYVIHAPAEMKDSDSLKVSISEIKYAQVYVQKAPARKYRYFSHLDA